MWSVDAYNDWSLVTQGPSLLIQGKYLLSHYVSIVLYHWSTTIAHLLQLTSKFIIHQLNEDLWPKSKLPQIVPSSKAAPITDDSPDWTCQWAKCIGIEMKHIQVLKYGGNVGILIVCNGCRWAWLWIRQVWRYVEWWCGIDLGTCNISMCYWCIVWHCMGAIDSTGQILHIRHAQCLFYLLQYYCIWIWNVTAFIYHREHRHKGIA